MDGVGSIVTALIGKPLSSLSEHLHLTDDHLLDDIEFVFLVCCKWTRPERAALPDESDSPQQDHPMERGRPATVPLTAQGETARSPDSSQRSD